MSKATLSGPLPTWLGNAASDLIHDALAKGMEPDEAADYARAYYGAEYLKELSTIVTDRSDAPMPEVVHD